MPTFNAQTYLVEAIDSLRAQTVSNFDLVILDGGSSDATLDIARSLQNLDSRIAIEVFPGLTPTQRINCWLRRTDADLVAMAHADDISMADRLMVQIDFMSRNADVSISGGATHYWLHEKSLSPVTNQYSGTQQYPLDHDAILCRLPFWWCFSVPSLIINAHLLRSAGVLLDETLECCSDYWFFWQAQRAGRLANISRTLIAYRHIEKGHGAQSRPQIAAETRIIRRRIAEEAGLWATLPEAEQLAFLDLSVGGGDRPISMGDVPATLAVLDRIKAWSSDQPAGYGAACREMLADYRAATVCLASASAEAERAAWGERLASAEAEQTALAQRLTAAEAERAALGERLASAEAERATLGERLASAEAERAELHGRLVTIQTALAAVWASRSWRLTAPLRSVLKLLRRRL
jgi:hypothetical protein